VSASSVHTLAVMQIAKATLMFLLSLNVGDRSSIWFAYNENSGMRSALMLT
jgi:hypothetical protein